MDVKWLYVVVCSLAVVGLYYAGYFWFEKRRRRSRQLGETTPIVETNGQPAVEAANETANLEIEDSNEEEEEASPNDWSDILGKLEEEETNETPSEEIKDDLIETIKKDVNLTIDLSKLNAIARITGNRKLSEEDILRRLQGERFKK